MNTTTLIPLGGKKATGQASSASAEEIARIREYQRIAKEMDSLPNILTAELPERPEIARKRRMICHRAFLALYPHAKEKYLSDLRAIFLADDAEALA